VHRVSRELKDLTRTFRDREIKLADIRPSDFVTLDVKRYQEGFIATSISVTLRDALRCWQPVMCWCRSSSNLLSSASKSSSGKKRLPWYIFARRNRGFQSGGNELGGM